MNPVPALPGDTKPWERLAAHVSHAGLYGLMFATTLVGWGLAGTMRTPLQQDIFGIKVPLTDIAWTVPVPSITEPTEPEITAAVKYPVTDTVLPSATLPVKLLPALARVRTPALPLKLAAPALAACVIAVEAACVIPNPFKVNVPEPTFTLPNCNAKEFVKLTLLAPLFDKVTAPVNAFALFKVIALLPAEKLEVPETVMMPD